MKAESVASLLSVQKNSTRVSDGISAETIKRTPDRTTSDVLKRISGASVQDNKFVIIRGLNDRYNTTYLNGAPYQVQSQIEKHSLLIFFQQICSII